MYLSLNFKIFMFLFMGIAQQFIGWHATEHGWRFLLFSQISDGSTFSPRERWRTTFA
jgi:hypothetical protein